MTNSASSTDKIFVHEHYAIHYRRATAARAQWAGGEAHPAYAALFVLGGAMRWQAGDGRGGELRESGLLVAAPGESVRARGSRVETLALSIAPDLRTAAAFERRIGRPLITPRTLLREARACRADELALGRSLVSRRLLAAARAQGLPSVIWTVDHPSWARRASALGLRAIITNDPARMRAALNDFRRQHDSASQRKE